MNKTIRIPKSLTRAATLVPSTGEGEREFSMSVSSDTPYLRYDWYNDEEYWEVLDHSPGGIDEERLKAGLPILFNHSRDKHLGRATKYLNDGHKITVSGFIWSESELAKEKKADAISGALPDTSVGYEITDEGECIGAKDGKPIYKFKWKCFESSLVTIPADASVGVKRERSASEDDTLFREISVRSENNIDPKGKNGEKRTTPKAMLKTPGQKFHKEADDNDGGSGISVEVVEERERTAASTALATERARLKKINDYVGAFNKSANLKKPIGELAREAIESGADFDTFRATVMDNWKDATQLSGADADPNIGMDRKEIRQFNFCKFFLQAHLGKLDGLEKEASDIAAKKYGQDGRQFNGRCIPHDVMNADFAEINGLGRNGVADLYRDITRAEQLLGRSQNATSFSAGGFLVGTQLLGGSFIDLLRNATLIGQGPFSCIDLSGLVGNIAIPKQTSTVTTYWLAEGATVSESNFAGGQLGFSPKRLVARNSFTKQLLAQSTPSIEMLVRNDLALAMGVEEDRACIQGTGLNGEPLGVINTSGVGANVTFSGNWTWAKTLLFESSLENANVRTGEMVFLTTPTIKGRAKATPVVAASTFPIFIWMGSKGEFPTINGVKGGIVNEYGAYATKNSPASGVVIFGVWNNNFTKARWAGIDVVVNPYTGDASEQVFVTVTQWEDFGIRYPQAFEVSTDAPTAP